MKAPVFIMKVFVLNNFLSSSLCGGWCMIVSGEEWCVTPAHYNAIITINSGLLETLASTGYSICHKDDGCPLYCSRCQDVGRSMIDHHFNTDIYPLLYTMLHQGYWGCSLFLVLTTPEIEIKTFRKNNSLYLHLISLVSNKRVDSSSLSE